jgi:hypothetical protein
LVGVPEMTGPVVSRTVMLNVFVALFPAASVAEQAMVVVPSGKVVPEAGAQVTAGVAGFVSVAVALKETTAPLAPVASTVMSAGTVMFGGVVSQPVVAMLALRVTVVTRDCPPPLTVIVTVR